MPEHILSLRYGKDSLACLGAIKHSGWPLDRIAANRGGIRMDYKKLVIRLKCPQGRERPIEEEIPSCQKCQYRISEEAALAITDLLVENQSLRNAANGFKARAEAAEARAEKAERERNDAVETIFKYVKCYECKHFDSDEEWCAKHEKYTSGTYGCSSPEWRGKKEE